jgi:hypothetical protein
MSDLLETRRRVHGLGLLALCLLTVVLYSNTWNAPFAFDDAPNITENAFVRVTELNAEALYAAAFESPSGGRPLANLSFALNYYFGNYEVTGYHLVNVAIHMVNGILVYLVALVLFGRQSALADQKTPRRDGRSIAWVALFAAALFVAHPVVCQNSATVYAALRK